MRETISHAGLQWKAILYGNNRYIDGRRECDHIRDSREIIYIYIYIYIIHLTYLYSSSITKLYHSVVSKNLIVFSMFDCLCRQRKFCHGNSESFHKCAIRRRGHIKTAIGIGLRTRPRLISVSPRYIFCLEYVSESRNSCLFHWPLLYVC